MDLDGDGDALDADDLAAATRAYWNDEPVGGSALLVRFQHGDQLGSGTHPDGQIGGARRAIGDGFFARPAAEGIGGNRQELGM